MTLSRPALRALAAAGALAVLLTACGGDGDDDADATTTTAAAEQTTTTVEETTTTTEAGRKGGDPDQGDDPDEGGEDPDEGGDADAEALAESIVLTEDDFVDGWTVEPNEDDGDELNQCWEDVDLDDVAAEVDGDTFSQEEGDNTIGVSSTALVLPDEDAAETLVEETRGDAWAACALDQLVASFEEDGLTVEDADLAPAEGVGTQGDETSVLNGYFVLSAEGTTYEGEISLWFVRTGEAVTGFNVFDLGDTEFATVVDQVADIVGDKHAAL